MENGNVKFDYQFLQNVFDYKMVINVVNSINNIVKKGEVFKVFKITSLTIQ